MENYDLLVIGSGPAGEKAAAKAAYFKHKVALVESSFLLGGTAVKEAVPAKALKEIAMYLSGKVEEDLYGRSKESKAVTSIDLFVRRAQTLSLAESLEVKENLKNHRIDFIKGDASFIDPHTIKIDGELNQTVSADNIIIATGTVPSIFSSFLAVDGKRIHNAKTILNIDYLPKSLCILGMGISGCEYGSIFALMGVKVTLVNRSSNVLPFFDTESVRFFVETLQSEGVNIMMNDEASKIEFNSSKNLFFVTLKSGKIIETDMLLYAFGRKGNIKSLKLENAGVQTSPNETIPVNAHYSTNVPHIYAVGDVNGQSLLANVAMDQGRVAVSHIFHLEDLTSVSSHIPLGMYSTPEIAAVGLTEQAAKEQGIEYSTGLAYYSQTTRGKFLGTEGLVKLVFKSSNKVIIGVHISGPLATEMIHYAVCMVRDERTLLFLIGEPFNYPTLHETFKYAAYDGLGSLAGFKLKQPHHRPL